MTALDDELSDLNDRIKTLVARRDVLDRQKREQDSRTFIEVNKITRDDIHISVDLPPSCFDIWKFARASL